MKKALIAKFLKKLNNEKKKIEKDLEIVAKKDSKKKGDWNARFPKYGNGYDEDSQEVTEYESRLSIEHTLELRLKDINTAVSKIENGKHYGKCEKCKKNIQTKRLSLYPEARVCVKCKK